MTTDTVEIESLRSERFHRGTITAGLGLLGAAALLTWILAGTWVTLGALGVVAGLGLGLSGRRAAQLQRRGQHRRSGPTTAPAAPPTDPRDIMVAAVRHDLPLMIGLCQGLPTGGLPRAGLLAEHTYAAVDVIGQLLGRGDHHGAVGPAFEQAAVTTQLGEVAGRTSRLYSGDRPGGLGDLDWHLARLWVLTEEYLAVTPGEVEGGRAGPAGTPLTWSPALGHRGRARALAWVAAASGSDLAVLRRGQALRTRLWLGSGVGWRARRRAARLWGRAQLSPTATSSGAVRLRATAPGRRRAA